jgi:excisionase family DNA binding protein
MNGYDEGRRGVLTTDDIELMLDLISRQMVSECAAEGALRADPEWWARCGRFADLGQRVSLMRAESGVASGRITVQQDEARVSEVAPLSEEARVLEEVLPSAVAAVDDVDQREYTTAEAARLLGLATSSVQGAVRAGKLAAHRADNGELRFTHDDIERYKNRPVASKGWDTRRLAAQVSPKSTRQRKG